MDIIYADGLPLYVPGNPDYTVYDMELTRKVNRSGNLSFTLPPDHPLYSSLNKLKSEIVIYRNGKRLWSGRIVSSKRDIFRCKVFSCEGELGYLNDSSRAPFSFSGTAEQYLAKLLENHNAQMYTDTHKRFTLGRVTVAGSIAYDQTEPQNTWELIDSNLLQTLGGYLAVREEDGAKYLDYLAEYGEKCDQSIELGVNLLDMEEYTDASGVYTVLVPLGKDKNGGYIGIGSDNELYYVQNEAAVNYYGRIVKTVIFDEISDPAELREAAEAELQKTLEVATTITASAVDLTDAGLDTDSFELGDYIRVYSAAHGLDSYFLCNEISERIGEPGSATYTLGASLVSLTAKQVAAGQRVSAANDAAVSAANTAVQAQQSVNALSQTVGGLAKTISGSVAVVIPAAGTVSTTVTFSSAFTAAPEVLLMPQKSGISYQITDITTLGFTFTASGTAGDQAVFSWIATK